MLQVNKFCLLTENLQPFKPRQDFVREVYNSCLTHLKRAMLIACMLEIDPPGKICPSPS